MSKAVIENPEGYKEDLLKVKKENRRIENGKSLLTY